MGSVCVQEDESNGGIPKWGVLGVYGHEFKKREDEGEWSNVIWGMFFRHMVGLWVQLNMTTPLQAPSLHLVNQFDYNSNNLLHAFLYVLVLAY